VLERIDAELGEVEDALRRLEEGTYGRCDVCGRPLDDDQLEAMPTARLCPERQPGPAVVADPPAAAPSGSGPAALEPLTRPDAGAHP
jgi:hypothetical protein